MREIIHKALDMDMENDYPNEVKDLGIFRQVLHNISIKLCCEAHVDCIFLKSLDW